MKDVLIVECNAFIRPDSMNKLRESILQQLEEKVVIIPAYAKAKLVSKPDDVEVQIEFKESNI